LSFSSSQQINKQYFLLWLDEQLIISIFISGGHPLSKQKRKRPWHARLLIHYGLARCRNSQTGSAMKHRSSAMNKLLLLLLLLVASAAGCSFFLVARASAP